ncbi:hypothetical protein H6F67_00120 [Microcoleus sp. FACHB-1515]|uniref:hypothetical protein n=1 Tax=Cyanophyceae TaxID=3028117 RepID=UPI001687063D|nr:hypothetical protein [Microcoleus sp. FACHB-1515]MBD2088280.1 hypothetical protein [Microcoleus sp. FACHB-1515]
MRIGDSLYFAPELPFSDLNLDSVDLGAIWEQRIRGFYLEPASVLISAKHAFAAGLLVMSAIDAMSRYEATPRREGERLVGKEFKSFVKLELPSFSRTKDAEDLYDKYRNGLAHEARLKRGAEFNLEQDETLICLGVVTKINPAKLLEEVDQALTKFVSALAEEENRKQFADALRDDFSFDLGLAPTRRTIDSP